MEGYWRTEESLDLLRKYADIGRNCHIASAARLDGWRGNQSRVILGNNVTITEGCMILCHDAAGSRFGLMDKVGFTRIGDNTFVGIRTVILAGLQVGKGCIIGACSVVTKDIPDKEVWAGNPARFICTVEEYKKKREQHELQS